MPVFDRGQLPMSTLDHRQFLVRSFQRLDPADRGLRELEQQIPLVQAGPVGGSAGNEFGDHRRALAGEAKAAESKAAKATKAANPDAFVAWSYPPDTFGLAEQAKIEGLNVKAYYSAVAVAFPSFRGKYGASIENVLGAGGIQDSPAIRDYYKRHKEVTGVDADYWGSPLYYTFLQILEQAFEGVGTTDREAIIAYLKELN